MIVFSKSKGIRSPFTSIQHWIGHRCKILRFDAKNDTFFADSVVQPRFRLLNFSFCQKNALHYISDPQIVSDKPLQISPIYLSGEMKKGTTYSVYSTFQCCQLKMILSFVTEMSDIDLLDRTSKLVELVTLTQSTLYYYNPFSATK